MFSEDNVQKPILPCTWQRQSDASPFKQQSLGLLDVEKGGQSMTARRKETPDTSNTPRCTNQALCL